MSNLSPESCVEIPNDVRAWPGLPPRQETWGKSVPAAVQFVFRLSRMRLAVPMIIASAALGILVNEVTYKNTCLLYTSPSPRDRQKSRMPSSA